MPWCLSHSLCEKRSDRNMILIKKESDSEQWERDLKHFRSERPLFKAVTGEAEVK